MKKTRCVNKPGYGRPIIKSCIISTENQDIEINQDKKNQHRTQFYCKNISTIKEIYF